MIIKPMLAKTADRPFTSGRYIYEQKIDGVRAIATVGYQGSRLQARSGADITSKFPELTNLPSQLSCNSAILDGELACNNFEGISHRIHKTKPLDIRIAQKQYPVTFQIFDILQVNGESVTAKPQGERKDILRQMITDSPSAMVLPWHSGDQGETLFEQAKTSGEEGVMAKDLTSPYLEGQRSNAWLKIKCFEEQSFFICGLTEGENSRASTFGSLILGKPQNGGWTYVGCAGSGLTELMRAYLLGQMTPAGCPFLEMPKLTKQVLLWSKPLRACEIRHLGYGSDGHLRFPTFRRLANGNYS